MPAQRKRIVAANPLEENGHGLTTLPGEGVATPAPAAEAKNPLLQGPKKLFAYKLPVPLGTKFKLYCHARGKTAEGVLAEILAEFLKDKKIDPLE
jgi:hypothetical protein